MTDVLYKLRIKNCNIIFKEGLEPGVLGVQVVHFNLDKDDPMFASSVLAYKDEFIDKMIEVEMLEDRDEG